MFVFIFASLHSWYYVFNMIINLVYITRTGNVYNNYKTGSQIGRRACYNNLIFIKCTVHLCWRAPYTVLPLIIIIELINQFPVSACMAAGMCLSAAASLNKSVYSLHSRGLHHMRARTPELR